MTYREILHEAMIGIADSGIVRFVGYNTAFGHKMNGTLVGCEHLCIETPVAENLMVGIATGLSLVGYLPVLCFERMDFMLAGADALVNHLINLQSYGMKVPVLIRAIVGNDQPLDPGAQHTQNFTDFFRAAGFTVFDLTSCAAVKEFYTRKGIDNPIITVEHRRLYDTTD